MAKYDIAISFAGEQRAHAHSLATRLDGAGYAVFFDEFREAELWGADLTVSLGDAYSKDARWCLVLVSQDYLRKPYTNLERQSALYRFMQERSGYLLCLRFDESTLPGLPGVIGYVDFRGRNEDSVVELLFQKLGPPKHDDHIPSIAAHDHDIARRVIAACYRRAIFTRMDSEIDMNAMYASISDAASQVQQMIAHMTDPQLQSASLRIVSALDVIERVRTQSDARISNHVEPKLRNKIDDEKRVVVRALLQIRRAAALAIQLPPDLSVDHFFSVEEAREKPTRR